MYGLLIWFLYNLIFRFILPVYRTSRQVKQQFRQMQEAMQNQARQQQGQQPAPSASSAQPKKQSQKPGGDYIDFEEIK